MAIDTTLKTINGATVLIETLKNLGIDTIFGYPGGIVLDVYDELSKQQDITHYLVRHEQSAIHAAEGYARACGKCGVVLVTSGPGATNIVTGLANAYLDGFPVIAITGQVSQELLHQDAFQEVDIVDITKSCTKKNYQVKSINDLQKTLIEAFEVANSGKKGPVLIDITKNVFSEKFEFKNFETEKNIKSTCPSLEIALDIINHAKSPIIIAGGGCIDASKELFNFVEKSNIPVVSTMIGLGNFPMTNDKYIGMIGIFGQNSANNAVKESDLVIAIGTRFNDRIRNCLNGNQKIIRIDINEEEFSKVINSTVEIVGDAKIILENLSKKVKKLDIQDWLNYLNILKSQNKLHEKKSDKIQSFELISEINKVIKNINPIITTEVGQHQVWASRYLKFNEPRKFITSGGLGTMGFGFPSAIGACIAKNEPVICIAGDGSIQMNIQEIATCMDYNLPVKVFVLNNGYLGMVRQLQEKNCEKRYYATKISNPDFVKLAQSYGAKAFRVEKVEDIKLTIEQALTIEGFVLVDFVIEPLEVL